ncbi:polysaccharide deacetylase [Siphonobacter sp. BAB-5385]|nr:polysaccharide deacetylase [Siphonobacter sp. BAB-5385]
MLHMGRWTFVVILLFLLPGCQSTTQHPERAGIALSFDDRFFSDWMALRPLLNQYQAKVTFYVNCPDSLTNEEVRILKTLQQDGHEIGFHGTIHGISTEMIQNLGVEGYLNTEIRPGISYLQQAGFHPTSYAHPGGNHNARVDSVLEASGFRILRDVALAERSYKGFRLYHLSPQWLPQIYYDFDQQRSVDALLFDTSANLSVAELRSALVRAKTRGKAVLLFGHQPFFSPPKPEQYGFDVQVLRQMLQTADSLHLKFYRMSDLPVIQ